VKVRFRIRDVTRLARRSASRLGAGVIAFVFVTMGGALGMDAHSAAHESHPGHRMAASPEAPRGHAAHHDDGSHAVHHRAVAAAGTSDDSGGESPATECTCVGPCQGGSAPSDTRTTSYEVAEGEVRTVRAAVGTARIIDRDPTAHLLPYPTAPPARV
jgi:hypothetical protein